MDLLVMVRTQPDDVQRLIVVLVMSLRIRGTAFAAWLTQ
jgi:hypothetical protein